ncbi:MAG: DUF1570 domain-containing protein [Planctomycetaceae bacterium]
MRYLPKHNAKRMIHTGRRSALLVILAIMGLATRLPADEFTYIDRQGETQTVQARLLGSGEGFFALEQTDGQILLVPEGSIEKRTPADDPEPLDGDQVAAKLQTTFGGPQKALAYVEKPQVLIYILHEQTADRKEIARKTLLMKQAARFLKSMHNKFLNFVRENRLEVQPLKFPLVVLIFERDEDFEDYTREVTGNVGLSAGAIAGFFDQLTNFLVLRESECDTFEVPLHESIHQQVFNRQILQRLAPVPVWFNEGLATGFEGDGKTVRKGPGTVSERYSFLALNANTVTWEEIVRSDKSFQGDVLAGEAYGHAWGLHWLMIVKHRAKYSQYVKLLAQTAPFTKVDEDDRLENLESIFDCSIVELHREFEKSIQAALKRIKPKSNTYRLPLGADHQYASAGPIDRTQLFSLRVRPFSSVSPHETLLSSQAAQPSEDAAAITVRFHRDEPSAAEKATSRQPYRFDLNRMLQSDIDFSLPVEKRLRTSIDR